MGVWDSVKQYSGYNIAKDVVNGNGKQAVQDMSKNDVVGNALGLPHIGDDPKTASTAGVTAAQQQDQALSTGFGQERQNYQPLGAPQIGAQGGVQTFGSPAAAYGVSSPSPTPGAPSPSTGPFAPGGFASKAQGAIAAYGGPAPAGAPPGLGGGMAPPPGAYSAAPGGPALGPVTQAASGRNHFGGTATPQPPTGPSWAGGAPGTTLNNQDRQGQALDMLTAQANGTAPSAAAIQSGQQLGTAMANQYAMASGLQGRHPGAAFDAAARGAATAQGDVIGQGAALRATEQANAQNTLANAVGGARGQDIQTNVANLNAKLTTMGYDEQTRNALLQAQLQSQGMSDDMIKAVLAANTQAANAKNAQNAQYLKMGSSLLA